MRSNQTTAKIMLHVLIALVPAMVMSAVQFGGRALMLTGVCVLSAMLWEKLSCVIMKRHDSTDDLSAMVTGMLLAFNLPPSLPYWIAVIGSFIAIVIVKQIFGGLGQNFANPAIVGRIVLMLSFTSEMTTWTMPAWSSVDVVSAPTPLRDDSGLYSYTDLFLGKCPGCMGEVCKAALLLGGVYLVIMRIIHIHAPVAFVGTVFVFSWLAGKDPVYQILSGGLILGAVFMATDYSTSPVTLKGQLVYGAGCGALVVLIRYFGGFPEGVTYAILIMNLCTWAIDKAFHRHQFGVSKADILFKKAEMLAAKEAAKHE